LSKRKPEKERTYALSPQSEKSFGVGKRQPGHGGGGQWPEDLAGDQNFAGPRAYCGKVGGGRLKRGHDSGGERRTSNLGVWDMLIERPVRHLKSHLRSATVSASNGPHRKAGGRGRVRGKEWKITHGV